MLPSFLDCKTRIVDPRSGAELDLSAFASGVAARAGELRSSGIGRGQCAIVAWRTPLDYLRDLFALWEAGAMAVAVNPAITKEERVNVMRATGASALLDENLLRVENDASASEPLGADDPALTLMTSGTTGRPKG
ncbi:AMP-binding protein, partial [Shinella sp.]|uniref:AMP-binding protein n=1 Tax=Shinella sp. TaxID=1870904 RepID=UPI003F6F835D